MPELHGDARGEALDARPRAPALRDAARRDSRRRLARPSTSRRRSTSAWPARGARPSARSASTWPPTRPSSCPTTTRAGCGRGRPTRSGLIPWWARLAALWPGAANALTQTPGLAALAKKAAGIAPQRRIPRFARRAVHALVPAPRRGRRAGRRRPAHPALAGHLQQLLPSRDGAGGGRGPGERRLRGGVAAVPALLRPPALRLRHARPREAAAPADLGRARRRDPRRHAGRRPRAELRGGLPRRAAQPLPRRRERGAPRAPGLPARRVPRPRGGRRRAAAPRPQGARPGPLPPEGGPGDGAAERVLARTGLDVEVLDAGCCGMAGAFGFEAASTTRSR